MQLTHTHLTHRNATRLTHTLHTTHAAYSYSPLKLMPHYPCSLLTYSTHSYSATQRQLTHTTLPRGLLILILCLHMSQSFSASVKTNSEPLRLLEDLVNLLHRPLVGVNLNSQISLRLADCLWHAELICQTQRLLDGVHLGLELRHPSNPS